VTASASRSATASISLEDIVVVEVKAVQKLLPIHLAQLLSSLKLGGLPVGLLINFHVAHLRHGIKRMVN
jgi:GxxExxY protein